MLGSKAEGRLHPAGRHLRPFVLVNRNGFAIRIRNDHFNLVTARHYIRKRDVLLLVTGVAIIETRRHLLADRVLFVEWLKADPRLQTVRSDRSPGNLAAVDRL